MKPNQKQFNIDYDNIAVGKGVHTTENRQHFIVTVSAFLELKKYSPTHAKAVAYGKLYGVPNDKMWAILNSPIIDTFEKERVKLSKEGKNISIMVKQEFSRTLLKLLYTHSEEYSFNKMLFE